MIPLWTIKYVLRMPTIEKSAEAQAAVLNNARWAECNGRRHEGEYAGRKDDEVSGV